MRAARTWQVLLGSCGRRRRAIASCARFDNRAQNADLAPTCLERDLDPVPPIASRCTLARYYAQDAVALADFPIPLVDPIEIGDLSWAPPPFTPKRVCAARACCGPRLGLPSPPGWRTPA